MHARALALAPALLFAAAGVFAEGTAHADDCTRAPPSNKLDTGARTREDVDVCAPEPPAAAQSAPVASATVAFWSTQRWFGVGLAAAGLVAAGVGSVLALQAKSKYDDALANDCDGDANRCSSSGIEQGRSAHDLASFATVAFVGAGALVGLGTVLFVLPLDPPPPAQTGLRVAPTLGANEAGLVLRARW